MMNIQKMMKQAQEMQQKMQEVQETVGQMEAEGSAGGGLVKVTMTCRGMVTKMTVDPSLVDPSEVEVMEDLIAAAVNDARGKADAIMTEETQKAMQGMGLPPGMDLPF
ncbi:MAG: YbaB/EbfC family nucleoid-associated protein [Alphaproteobacteria bacterium]|nr:YbaB/EbfC family nucleoid-associated protein [Alphaproteobacteria bacterium]MCS5597526.1 YbaB/EbfC family nucleoid-associated protein [Alphaproteobacteria bacterium]|tara:strand:+ start:1545 stop:1868 length:324 start_codon:yes stop_codon:yes gene_type:complete